MPVTGSTALVIEIAALKEQLVAAQAQLKGRICERHLEAQSANGCHVCDKIQIQEKHGTEYERGKVDGAKEQFAFMMLALQTVIDHPKLRLIPYTRELLIQIHTTIREAFRKAYPQVKP